MEQRRLSALESGERAAIVDRDAGIDDIRDDVDEIVARVCDEGDAALRAFAREFDGVEIDEIDVTHRLDDARGAVDRAIRDAIEEAASNVSAFHERHVPADWREDFDGRELGRRFRPIERAGVYVPGGTAAYPSSALMGIIPAVVAGVDEIVVVTPPAEELNPVTLAAIAVAGADRVYVSGGAQAIAALAYGTETIDPVDKIVGPGNPWVTAAKVAVQDDVPIDFAAGPSEILVIADRTAESAFVAADLVAQAEHGPDSPVVLVTDDPTLAENVVKEIERQTAARKRADVIRAALDSDASGVFVVDSMDEAVAFAEEYAAEHLSIQSEDDEAILERIDSAGSVFLGPHTPVAAGDYASGTNHVLPTNGGARATGGLSVDTFLRATTVQRLDRDALANIGDTITTLARAEGLEAHAASIDRRLEE